MQPPGCPQQLAISFDGRLDNRDELISRLSTCDLQNRSDAACALAAYREFGDSFAQHLKGDFAIAIFDCAQQKLLLSRDIMGIRPLYYCQTEKTFVAASEIKSILAYPGFQTRPDDDALADLLLGGDPYEMEHTCFFGISRVLQGHTVVVTPENIRSFQHWDFDTSRQIRCASIEEYAERFRFLFAQAVQRRLRSSHPVAVMVSGGLDSSAILCQAEMLKREGASVAPCVGIAMTFPENTDADEKLYLDEIEESCRIRIQRRAFSGLRFVDNEKAIWSSEFPQLEWDARTELKRLAHQSGCRVALDGYYGDQMLANPAYLVDLARNFRWTRLRRDFAEWSRWMADLDPGTVQQELRWILFRGLVPYKLVRTFRRHRGIPPSRQPSWYSRPFRERAYRRYVASKRLQRRFASHYEKTCYEFLTARSRMNSVETYNKSSAVEGLDIAYPFMDSDLIEFLLAIPGCALNWNGVPKGLFREAMKGVLPESIRLRNWKSDFTALNNDAVESDYEKFQTYLGTGCSAVTNGFMDPIGLQSDFSKWKFDQNSILPAVQVTAAVAFELWLRLFWANNEFSSHTGINL